MTATRPRILHIVNDLNSGGLEMNLLTLVQTTTDRFTHSVCCIRERGALAERFEAAAVEVTALGTAGRDLTVAWRLARECRRLRPQIVHTRNWGTIDGIVGARFAGVPVVIHSEHGRDAKQQARRRAWILQGLSFWIDAVIAVSEHLGRHLREDVGIRPDKISVIRNGVDPQRFRPSLDRVRLRRELGLDPGARIVIAVGRLDPVKNYGGLIAAFARARERCPDACLVIAGDGPERQCLEREVAAHALGTGVRLVGHRHDVERWLGAADVFAHASVFEGIPNAALEAMAAGLPVVATKVGGLQEIVVDGITGRLVQSGDEIALADAIAEYCDDPQAPALQGDAGRRRVLAEFTPEAMTAAYAQLYERTLAHHGMPHAEENGRE